RVARFPLVVESGCLPDGPRYTVTEDVSRAGMSALLADSVPVGSELDFAMSTPLGEVRGRIHVVRAKTIFYASRGYQRCALEFDSFAPQGRTSLEMVINPPEHPPFQPTL